MAKKEAADIYMNWFGMEVTAAAASNTLSEASMNAMGGVATGKAWRIHEIEWFPNTSATTSIVLDLAISTRKSLSAMPAINDKGLVAVYRLRTFYTANAMDSTEQPIVRGFLPPMIIASPNLSLYCQTNVDHAAQQSVAHRARIGFTVVELDSDAYRELYGTWNFAD